MMDDRLSKLPDDIIHYILSLSGFQIFDLVALGVLSKRWNHLWVTMPYLDVDMGHAYLSRFRGVPRDHTLLEKFRRFIDWVLIRQGESRLVRFRLRLIHEELFNWVQVSRWLCAVAERNVQELDLEVVPKDWGFSLPLCIAVNDSLRVLKLTLCNNFMRLPSVVRLSQLRFLHLNNVGISSSDLLQRLFSGCCSLESLRLNDCVPQSFSFWDFSSTHLKELIIFFTERFTYEEVSSFEIKVSCPKLILFKYAAPAAINLILENVSSLETVLVDLHDVCSLFREEIKVGHMMHRNLKEVRNVTDLKLGAMAVDGLSYIIDDLINCPPSFPAVKSFEMEFDSINLHMQIVFLLLNHCPSLEVLTLVFSDSFVDEEWEAEHWELQCQGIVSWKSHPHLKTIKCSHFMGTDDELDVLRFLLKNARFLEKLDIIWYQHSDISAEISEKVLMFPKASSELVVTVLGLSRNQGFAWLPAYYW